MNILRFFLRFMQINQWMIQIYSQTQLILFWSKLIFPHFYVSVWIKSVATYCVEGIIPMLIFYTICLSISDACPNRNSLKGVAVATDSP